MRLQTFWEECAIYCQDSDIIWLFNKLTCNSEEAVIHTLLLIITTLKTYNYEQE